MNNKYNDKYIVYGIGILLLIIGISYLIYTSYSINSNISNNKSEILEQNNIVIYEEAVEQYEIASYSTHIYDNEKNRIHNIMLACDKLNGYVVSANTEFSFNQVLGKMDKNDGFKKATGFDNNGRKIKIYGGGICQLSSTLYNAILICNLEVTERHPHSRRVNYVPKNKDATVFYGTYDFKFINSLENDIIIYANTDGNNVTIQLMTTKKISKPLL